MSDRSAKLTRRELVFRRSGFFVFLTPPCSTVRRPRMLKPAWYSARRSPMYFWEGLGIRCASIVHISSRNATVETLQYRKFSRHVRRGRTMLEETTVLQADLQ